MAQSELAIKYSNNTYATKREVSEVMHTPLVDNIWNNILEYRSNFAFALDLKHITGSRFNVCLTPGVLNIINNVERKFMKFANSYQKAKIQHFDFSFKNNQFVKELEEICKKYSLNDDETQLNQIVNNDLGVIPAEYLLLNRYLKCLKDIESNYMQKIDKNLIDYFYQNLTSTENSGRMYRSEEINSDLNRVVINKLYIGTPVNIIDRSMDELVDFINNSNASIFVKACSALYFFSYIKPFEFYSEEIGVLLFKKIFAINDLEDASILINFECLLNKKDDFEKWLLESQRTFDLTYFVLFMAKETDKLLDEALDSLLNHKVEVVNNEFYSKEVEEVVPTNLEEEQNSIQIKETKEENGINYQTSIAISSLPEGLDEEEAQKLEAHLLELNPSLSKNQAYFYARHCTLGKSYTIGNFKKCCGVVYETARTSMDNLASLGYYKKEMFKNKFIYLPIKKN